MWFVLSFCVGCCVFWAVFAKRKSKYLPLVMDTDLLWLVPVGEETGTGGEGGCGELSPMESVLLPDPSAQEGNSQQGHPLGGLSGLQL